jgi:hypothetical protein
MTRLIIQFGRSNIILGLIIGVGLISGYLSYSQSDDPTVAFTANEQVVKDDLSAFDNFKIDFSILDDENYKALQIYGENPVDPGITGERLNPFAPLGIDN